MMEMQPCQEGEAGVQPPACSSLDELAIASRQQRVERRASNQRGQHAAGAGLVQQAKCWGAAKSSARATGSARMRRKPWGRMGRRMPQPDAGLDSDGAARQARVVPETEPWHTPGKENRPGTPLRQQHAPADDSALMRDSSREHSSASLRRALAPEQLHADPEAGPAATGSHMSPPCSPLRSAGDGAPPTPSVRLCALPEGRDQPSIG